MYRLEHTYGKTTYEEWSKNQPDDLSSTQTSPDEANGAVWDVASFRELADRVAFLGSLNKRLTLLYRGQTKDLDPLPVLFRSSWKCFDSGMTLQINNLNREHYWRELELLGRRVFDLCNDPGLGLPRKTGLRDIREVQWAVIQHYEVWPTPLIDLTSSLRAACSFAFGLAKGTKGQPRVGFIYVVRMPHAAASITFDIDQHIVLARLQSACPPIARRPHYQEGYLVGRFPMYSITPELQTTTRLARRLIAKFRVQDSGAFWDDEFPLITAGALMPQQDPLYDRLQQEFGVNGSLSVHKVAEKLSVGSAKAG